MPTAVTSGSELDLLVLSANGDTPDQQTTYQVVLNYGGQSDPTAPYSDDEIPAVPNWHSALHSGSATWSLNNRSVTREPGLTLHTYNSGTSSVTADVQLYVLRITISPTTTYPLTSIVLPFKDTTGGQLHVFAINTH